MEGTSSVVKGTEEGSFSDNSLQTCDDVKANAKSSVTGAGLQREPCPFNRSKKLREQFEELEQLYEKSLKGLELSEADWKIVQFHQDAIEKKHFTYDDPETGYKVMTRLRHFLRGSCCGNACRHCIYEHESVPDNVKLRREFNGAFWVNKKTNQDDTELYPSPAIEKNKEDIQVEEEDPKLFKH